MKRQHRLLVFGTALLLAGGLTSSPLAFAGGAGSTLVQDFSSSVPTVASDWQLPGANGTDDGNDACLVPFQGESATAPITDCADGDTSDEDFDYIGRSGLQLTPDVTWQEGGVAWGTSVPTSEGLDITFNSYQYPGTTPDQTPADGISFFLAASDPTDPTNSASAVTLGPPGADLGYSADPGDDEDGLTNAYLGVGLDVFGNFSNSGSDFTPGNDGNCSGVTTQSDVASQVPESLDVRGPGNGQSGYCLMNSTQVSNLDNGGVLDGLDSGGNPIAVPVEIVINPTSSTATTPSGFQVPAGQYLVDVTMTDGNQYQETGELPDATPYAGNNPNGWYDGDGVPKQLSFGWAASTGADREFHTISDLDVSSLGTPPQYSVTLADNSGGGLFNGQQVTYTATPTLSGASETRPITVTDTFPSTLTPPNPSMNPFTTNGWTCNTDTATGQTVTCTMSPPSGGQPPGQLNAVAIPVTVNAPPGNPPTSISDSVTVSSDDGQPATTTDSEPFSTATTLAFTNQPNNAQVNTGQDVKISAEIGSNGPVDTTYTGPVTLSIANNPSKARFVVGSGTASTLTVNAQKGVADFPNVALNAVGFGYTLGASAPNVSSATSKAFDINSVAKTCPTGPSCTTGTVSSTVPGTSAVVTEPSGQGTLTASFGGNVAPIHPCTNTAPAILSFTGTAQKVIKYTYATKIVNPLVCYGQPTPFLDILLIKTTYYNQTNQEFEGLLPLCLPKLNGPCISNISWVKGSETVTIQSAANDPHTTPGG